VNRLKAVTLFLALALAPAIAQVQTAEQKGQAIALEADRRDRGFGDSAADLRMILRSRGGDERTRELRSRVLERPEGDRSLVVFDSPPDVRGTALLTYANRAGEDDQWLYLPALKRARRISASNRSGPFMGSEFSYEDLASELVEKFTYRWLRDEACPGEALRSLTCFVVERRPVDASSAYSRQIVWIDQDEYRTVNVEYYDRKNVLLKTLSVTQYQQHGERFWRAGEMLMTNHQTGQSTRLAWSRYQFGVGLRESDFTPQALTRVR
jgi:outer membrane lipoprotein-sorting protein